MVFQKRSLVHWFRCFVAATLSFLVTAPLAAQPDDLSSVFGEIVDVRVVNLEVVVENRKGERIPGLGVEDFRLLVDGEEVPLSFFSEIQLGRAVPAETNSSEPDPDGVDPVETGPFEAGQRVGTSYLVFIDEAFSRAKQRNRVLKGIREHVSRLGAEDRMAIVAFDGQHIDMLSTWSQSPADLQSILDKAMERKAFGFLTQARVRLNVAGSGVVSEELEDRLENISLAVAAALRGFANPPGRKVLLLASGGWPYSPETYLQSSGVSSEFDRSARIYGPIYETANLLGYTIYPIDVAGMQIQGPDATAERPGSGFDTTQEDSIHDTLRLLARETGGKPLLDSARLKSLAKVVEDTRSYYWLGFTPFWQGNDEQHEIKVEFASKELARPGLGRGLKLRYRSGFQDLSRKKEVSFMVESALLFGDLPGAKPLRVELGQVEKKRERKRGRFFELPIRIFFPLDEVTVLQHQDEYVVELEMRIASIDARGNHSDLDVSRVSIRASGPPEPGEEGLKQVTLQLNRRPEKVIVSLHDPLSGAILVTKVVLDPA